MKKYSVAGEKLHSSQLGECDSVCEGKLLICARDGDLVALDGRSGLLLGQDGGDDLLGDAVQLLQEVGRRQGLRLRGLKSDAKEMELVRSRNCFCS